MNARRACRNALPVISMPRTHNGNFIFCKFILFIIYMNRPRYHSQLRVFRYCIFPERDRERGLQAPRVLYTSSSESNRHALWQMTFFSMLFSRQDTLEECHTPLCNVERTNGIFSFFRVLFSRWWWAGCQLGGRPFFGHGKRKELHYTHEGRA